MAHGRLTKVSRPAKKATEATGRHLCHAGWFGFPIFFSLLQVSHGGG
jgi:hypothetical protein